MTKALKGLRINVPLAPHTTFNIGGSARYFFSAKTTEDIKKALQFAKQERIPFFILGAGSKLLVSDRGFFGLVIKLENKGFEIQRTQVRAESGVMVQDMVEATIQAGLKGWEWAGGLPGTIGGAIHGNAGAFRGEVKDSVVSVECMDEGGNEQTLSNKDCRFGYRDSVFKQKNLIVVSAVFSLSQEDSVQLRTVAEDHIRYRKDRHPLHFPNAGSIFKNCELEKFPREFLEFVKPVVKVDPFPVVPIAFLISEAGLKGMQQGDAEISTMHPNFIINKGHATFHEVLLLMQKVKNELKKKYKIELEEEIQRV